MKYRTLGKTGLKVSEIGFGAWSIGGEHYGPTDDEVSISAIHKALDTGVNFIDTANIYGKGHSEKLVTKALKSRSEDIIVATKAGNDYHHGIPVKPNYDAEYLEFCVNESLQRLETDCLDILQLHGPDLKLIKMGEIFETLNRFKEQGKIRFAGISVRSYHEDDEGLLAVASEHIDVLQIRYNLLEQDANKMLFPNTRANKVGVIIRSPLLFGLLADRFNPKTRFEPPDHRALHLAPDILKVYLEQFEEMRFLFDGSFGTPVQVALRFILSDPAVSVVIPGARTPEQADMNDSASDMGPLPDYILEKIHKIAADFEEIGASKFR